MLKLVDRFLNGITMYRLVMYVLGALAAVAIVLATFGILTYSAIGMVVSLLILVFVTYGSNELFARLFKIQANPESSNITAGILFFVFSPPSTLREALLIALAAVVASASKYVLAFRRQHLFNPAALAAVVVGIPTGLAAWWVGTPVMLVPTLIAALLVVRKVRRFELFLAVIVPGAVAATLLGLSYGQTIPAALWQFVASWPIVFFAAFMVTEPFTSPGTRKARLLYGAGIGILSSLPIHVGIVYTTPELTLLLGNLGAFFTGLRRRLVLRFARRTDLAAHTHGFHFTVSPLPTFKPGQYLEWTLPHAPDLRGIRRFFTIASAPSEPELALGVKFMPEGGSSFKERLLALQPGDIAYASMRGGTFVLPTDSKEKLAFIAGGIGVTPFRSMVRHLIDTDDRRDITLFYACKTGAEIAYHELWDEALAKIGMRTVCVLSDEEGGDEHGFITNEMLAKRLPDWKERTFYLSGPDGMVQAYKKLLRGMGVSRGRIRTDYFPGF